MTDPTYDTLLADELGDLVQQAHLQGDELLALALRAAEVLARFGEHRGLARVGALFGAASVVLRRGEDPSVGMTYRAARAIISRIGLGARSTLPDLTLDEVIVALGRERAHRERLEQDYVRLRLELTEAQRARSLLTTPLPPARGATAPPAAPCSTWGCRTTSAACPSR